MVVYNADTARSVPAEEILAAGWIEIPAPLADIRRGAAVRRHLAGLPQPRTIAEHRRGEVTFEFLFCHCGFANQERRWFCEAASGRINSKRRFHR